MYAPWRTSTPIEPPMLNTALTSPSYIARALAPAEPRMLKLFRSSGIESILEGTVTQTGAAFVMKRKIGNMKDFFWWRKNKQTLVDTTIRVAPKLQIEDKSSGLEAPVASPVKRTVKE